MALSPRRVVVVFLLLLVALTGVRAQSEQPCSTFPVEPNGWQRSYRAPCVDRHGILMGGSEMLHLVAHEGKLYAANGYWEDKRNPIYGGEAPNAGWAQILRLDSPDATWESDLELGPRHLRAELLKSITFTIDGGGHPLARPENLLVAATYDLAPGGGTTIFVRDDDTGTWRRTAIADNLARIKGEDRSVRAMIVHRDAVTGIERVFISVGVLGIYSGVYDPKAPGLIRWDAHPESPQTGTRVLALTEANGSLFFSEGVRIYRRIDGPSPRYVVAADLSDLRDSRDTRAMLSTVGGIRGMTAVVNPSGSGDSLIFVWASGARSQACVYRLDPDGKGGYERRRESCLAALVSQYLGGVPVPYVLGAYNDFLAVRDPATSELLHLIGLEAFIAEKPVGPGEKVPTAPNQRRETGGFYAGALYAIRNSRAEYRIGEVDAPASPLKPPLVSVRAYALSPFPGSQGAAIYFAGYDADWFPSSDTAWIFHADLATVLR